MINHPLDQTSTTDGLHQTAVPYGRLGADQHGAEIQTFRVNADTQNLTTVRGSKEEDWRILCGCHVRTATLWIGGIYIVIRTLILILLIIALASSVYLSTIDDNDGLQSKIDDDMNKVERIGLKVNVQGQPSSPKVFGTGDTDKDSRDLFRDFSGSSDDIKTETHQTDHKIDKIVGILIIVMIVITLIQLIFESLMIHGALKYKPKLMMPYLVVNVFVICLRIIGLLIGLKTGLLQEDRKILIAQIISLFELIFMGYLTWIVWRCYKYCKMYRHSLTRN